MAHPSDPRQTETAKPSPDAIYPEETVAANAEVVDPHTTRQTPLPDAEVYPERTGPMQTPVRNRPRLGTMAALVVIAVLGIGALMVAV
jgi:hypothetical protein